MNRLEAFALPPASDFSSTALDLAGPFDRFDSSTADPPLDAAGLATFAPARYESGYAYPLVVWLHGEGESPETLPSVMTHVSTQNFVAAAPAATGDRERRWSDDAEGIQEVSDRVFDAVAAASSVFSVHPERVFIAGVGRGGTAALRVALTHPDSFAGAASFDGPAPSGNAPLRQINALRGLPLMLGVGAESRRYPESRVCRDLRTLHAAGCTLNLRHEPGDGDLTTGMLAEFNRWMMAIVCGE